MLFGGRGRKRKKKLLRRLISSFFTAIILASLVLFVVLAIQIASGVDEDMILGYVKPVLSKVNVSIEIPGESTKVAIMADSEGDFEGLEKALGLAKEQKVSAVAFLGDFTTWGDLGGLERSKELLDASQLDYYALPGDHDLANAVQEGDLSGLKNFEKVFGDNAHTFLVGNSKVVVLDNSANYTRVDSGLVSWFKDELESADFVMLSQPLYHPTNPRVMGVVDGQEVEVVRAQANELLEMIRQSKVKAVIAADQHVFSRSKDPVRDSLEHIVVGALISNDKELRNPQSPRFAILHVFKDGSYEVEEVIL